MRRLPAAGLCALAALLVPGSAAAHGFGRLYNLPVPFWLYAWAGVSALLLSFLLAAWFANAPAATDSTAERELRWASRLRRGLPVLKGISLLLLLLCIATAAFGNRDPYRNFSMTCFWVVFLLGFTYLTAFVGNLYALANPWRLLAGGVDRVWRGYSRGRLRYPERLGDWPALALYLGFIWLELFGHGKPDGLARMLVGYTLLNLAGVWLVGAAAWFHHCEFFSLFLRLVALIAPLAWRDGRLYRRRPFAGLLHERPAHLSTVVFVLAMLSSTSFDGLRATQVWVALFWWDPTGIVTQLAGGRPGTLYAELRPWYIGWETFWLLVSPFLYLGAYLGCLALAKGLTGSRRPLRELALDFGYSLLPIVLVYHMTHYATLLLTQGLKIISLASDPFGWGWNLFGTLGLLRAPILPPMGAVWHSQVGLILFGHIVSVGLAHLVALRVFPTRRQAVLSQLPMLLLMLLFTVIGLWILAQPLTMERMS